MNFDATMCVRKHKKRLVARHFIESMVSLKDLSSAIVMHNIAMRLQHKPVKKGFKYIWKNTFLNRIGLRI